MFAVCLSSILSAQVEINPQRSDSISLFSCLTSLLSQPALPEVILLVRAAVNHPQALTPLQTESELVTDVLY